jgi:iron(III) transport system permease protein
MGQQALPSVGVVLRSDSRRGIITIASLTTALCLLPILSLFVVASEPQPEWWTHLIRFVLPHATRDTLLLLVGVSTVAGGIGVVLAALVSLTDFPGRRLIKGLAILPLAFPIYLHAFIYVEILDASGKLQLLIRHLLGAEMPALEVRSMWGAISIFSLVLYPYVYLPLVIAFSAQSTDYRDVARTLGCSPWGAFWRVQLPGVRPAFVAGLSLALMEALADFGASEYLSVRTYAYMIYSTWITRGSLAAAAQLALVLVAIVGVLVVVENYSRRASSHVMRSGRTRRSARIRLGGPLAILASLFSFVVVGLAFVVPAGFLIQAALLRPSANGLSSEFFTLLARTTTLAVTSAVLIAMLATVLGLLPRWDRRRALGLLVQLSTIGYAVPGVVLALGALFAYTSIDHGLDAVARRLIGSSAGLLISGTPVILFLAYLSRFMAVGHGPISSRLLQLSTAQDDVARTLGRSLPAVFGRILLPQLSPALAAAVLLLAVDIMKELPMTLLLRPIGVETLATSLYGDAARGQFEDGSTEALAILAVGVAAVLIIQKLVRQRAPLMF